MTNTNDIKDIIAGRMWTICCKYHSTIEKQGIWELNTLLGCFYHGRFLTATDGKFASDDNDKDTSDKEKIECLIEEIRHLYEELEILGISKEMVRQVLWDDYPISRLSINDSGIIKLIDYQKEVHLTPLQFSIYQVFVNHHDGLLLKDFPDYKDELLENLRKCIGHNSSSYKRYGLHNEKHLIQTIENVTDTTTGALNENISRIKRAFTSALGERAQHYFINGVRGGVYKIMLGREFFDN